MYQIIYHRQFRFPRTYEVDRADDVWSTPKTTYGAPSTMIIATKTALLVKKISPIYELLKLTHKRIL